MRHGRIRKVTYQSTQIVQHLTLHTLSLNGLHKGPNVMGEMLYILAMGVICKASEYVEFHMIPQVAVPCFSRRDLNNSFGWVQSGTFRPQPYSCKEKSLHKSSSKCTHKIPNAEVATLPQWPTNELCANTPRPAKRKTPDPPTPSQNPKLPNLKIWEFPKIRGTFLGSQY